MSNKKHVSGYLKKFDGILTTAPNRYSTIKNYERSAMSAIARNILLNGVALPQKKIDQIDLFLLLNRESIVVKPNKSDYSRWLVVQYINPCFPLLGRKKSTARDTGSTWRIQKNKVFDVYGADCMRCGAKDEGTIDHIKPVSKYPDLEHDFDNLQVLCRSCNSWKGNRKIIDFRPKKST